MYTKTQLLKAVRAAGFKGDETPEAIKAWVEAEGYELPNDLDIDKCFVTKAKLSIEPASDPDDAIAPKAKPANTVNKAAAVDTDIQTHQTKAIGADGWERIAARKRYERNYNLPKGDARKSLWDCYDKAEAWKSWSRLAIAGPRDYAMRAYDKDIVAKTQITTDNTLGGATVPSIFVPELIDLKEDRGAARQVIGITPMQNDTGTYPRRTSGLTVYAPGEGGAITASSVGTDNVTLTATKMACLAKVSSELMHDAALSWSDIVAREIAYAFADKEDEIVFNGDGTSTYFGYTGIRPKLFGLSGTIANIAGLKVGAGDLFSEAVMGDFTGTIAKSPAYVDRANPVWVIHKTAWAQTILRLQMAQGGVTVEETTAGLRYFHLGAPIVFSQVMPRSDAAFSTIYALYGAFSQGAKIGEVANSMTIASSEHSDFANDLIAIRGTERFACAVHDVGNASATVASQVPGPIVGLISAGS